MAAFEYALELTDTTSFACRPDADTDLAGMFSTGRFHVNAMQRRERVRQQHVSIGRVKNGTVVGVDDITGLSQLLPRYTAKCDCPTR